MQLAINYDTVRFNGSDYQPLRDNVRLGKQLEKIFNLMRDGQFRTLSEIHSLTGEPEASISAQLRHLKKERFGSHKVEKEYVGSGLFKYKLIVNETH